MKMQKQTKKKFFKAKKKIVFLINFTKIKYYLAKVNQTNFPKNKLTQKLPLLKQI